MDRDSLQQKQLHDALLNAFPTHNDLAMMVAYGLDVNLAAIAGEGPLEHAVFKLVQWARAKGRVEELVSAALKRNGQNPALISVAQQLGVSDEPHSAVTTLLATYAEKLRNDPEITHLQVLGMNYPLQVSDIYVKVRLTSPQRPRYEREKTQRKSYDPLSIMQQQERWLAHRTNAALDPAIAIKQYQRCVIVGNPGAGKTTMLKRLTLLSINNELAGLPNLPVYIKLHELARSGSDDLLDFAAKLWERTYAIPQAQAAQILKERMDAGTVLFLLDALDETVIGDNMESAEQSYHKIAQAIMHLTQRYHRVPIVVTARKEGYQQRGPLTGFTRLEVLDFLPEQIEQFIGKWFEHYGDERRPGFASALIAALKKQLRMATLAANPLLLSLIVLVYEDLDQQLPENRSQLYQKCVDTLLTKWDAERRMQRARPFGSDGQQQLLERIAWHMHSQGLRACPASQLIPIIADFLRMRGRKASQAHAVLQAISGDDGLLREQATGFHGFLHLTLQEFFAAKFVEDIALLLTHLADPWWEEVILLYIGQARNATLLLERLLTPSPTDIPEDIFASKLILAGRCLAAHPTIENVQLWQDIPDQLFDKLLHTDYSLTQQHIAEALAEIGHTNPETGINERLLTLLKDEKCSQAVRISIVTALGDCGVREVAAESLEFFVEEGARLDMELQNSIVDTLALIADRQLLARLQELILDTQRDPLILMGLANVISNVGDANTARILLPSLSDPMLDRSVRGVLASTVVALGDPSTIEALIKSLATSGHDEWVVINVVLALSDRGYRAAVPELLALIPQQQMSLELLVIITYVLSIIGDESIADQLASLINNPTLDITIRSCCARTFTRCVLRTRKNEILGMLTDTTIDRGIRLNVSMGLANAVDQGDRILLADLQRIAVQEQDGTVKFLHAITSGLLGDLSVLPLLRRLFAQEPEFLRQSVARLIVQHTSTSDLMDMLTNKKSQYPLRARLALAEAIGEIGDSPLVPSLLTVLEDRVVIEEVRIAVAKAIGQLGETRETVERLLKLWQALCLYIFSPLVDQLYQAMWAVSRRCGVVVVQDGFAYRVLERQSVAER